MMSRVADLGLIYLTLYSDCHVSVFCFVVVVVRDTTVQEEGDQNQ